jgi:DNA-binding FadR family transcriptional regulator
MEHKGLVSRVAEQLERMIALGQLPQDTLPSERMMAKRYGVSRTTIRGALQGLAARGLIVQHPGRQSRAVALNEALSLESLKLVVPEGRTDLDRRRLLEGYFSLKREVTVELLAACCEHASKEDVDLLLDASFALREETRWQEERKGWVLREFNLLRLAARAADRPGHALLILSLEKAFRSLADHVLGSLQPEALQKWAQCVFNALCDRDAQTLRRELPALLKAADEPLLDHLAPVREADIATEPAPTTAEEPLPGAAGTNRYACHTSSRTTRRTEGPPSRAELAESGPTSGHGSPTGSPAPLAPASSSEFQEPPGDSERGLSPKHPGSISTAPENGLNLPPTLLMALGPPMTAAREVCLPEEHPGPEDGADRERADSWSHPVAREPESSD